MSGQGISIANYDVTRDGRFIMLRRGSHGSSLPHDKLIILIKQRVVDGSMLRLIKQSLTVGIAYEGKVEPTTVGVPQGSPISPLYSNIYLNLLDQVWHKRGYPEKLGEIHPSRSPTREWVAA